MTIIEYTKAPIIDNVPGSKTNEFGTIVFVDDNIKESFNKEHNTNYLSRTEYYNYIKPIVKNWNEKREKQECDIYISEEGINTVLTELDRFIWNLGEYLFMYNPCTIKIRAVNTIYKFIISKEKPIYKNESKFILKKK